jgi:ketosteroid isomerase-like protein
MAEETLRADVALIPPEDSPFPETGTKEYRGHEGFLRFVAGQTEGFESMWIEPEDFVETGDKVVVPLRFGGQARHSAIEVEFSFTHVLTFEAGKLALLDIYTTLPQALEAVGLRE